ncbi:MAG: hypothetical protein Q9177_005798, partial [Variospora cf. flavescens]
DSPLSSSWWKGTGPQSLYFLFDWLWTGMWRLLTLWLHYSWLRSSGLVRSCLSDQGSAPMASLTLIQVTSTVPLYFQVTQDAKAASAGARLLPGLIAYALGGVIAGIIISRYIRIPTYLPI